MIKDIHLYKIQSVLTPFVKNEWSGDTTQYFILFSLMLPNMAMHETSSINKIAIFTLYTPYK